MRSSTRPDAATPMRPGSTSPPERATAALDRAEEGLWLARCSVQLLTVRNSAGVRRSKPLLTRMQLDQTRIAALPGSITEKQLEGAEKALTTSAAVRPPPARRPVTPPPTPSNFYYHGNM